RSRSRDPYVHDLRRSHRARRRRGDRRRLRRGVRVGGDRAESRAPALGRRRAHRCAGSHMTRWVWIDGALADADTARVSPFDHGLLVGDGVFETLRVYDGQPFAWTRHLDRLEHSANGLGLRVPDRAVVQDAARAVLAANELTEARLRVTVT